MSPPRNALHYDDPIAERRYAYAQAAARDGDWAVAAEVLLQALEIAPDWAPAWFALAEARDKLGDAAGAREAFARALRADPEDSQGAGARLARLEGVSPAALPAAYIARLFDGYAERFDRHLVGDLAYSGPRRIAEALERAAPGRRFARALDLGCGTGLAALTLRERVAHLEGVDLSEQMIEAARKRGLYDALIVGEVVAELARRPDGALDLAVAADVFVYFGALDVAFAELRRTLADDGIVVFTLEASEGEGFELSEGLRFRHALPYVRDELARAGLDVIEAIAASSRREAGHDAPGWLIAARKARAAA